MKRLLFLLTLLLFSCGDNQPLILLTDQQDSFVAVDLYNSRITDHAEEIQVVFADSITQQKIKEVNPHLLIGRIGTTNRTGMVPLSTWLKRDYPLYPFFKKELEFSDVKGFSLSFDMAAALSLKSARERSENFLDWEQLKAEALAYKRYDRIGFYPPWNETAEIYDQKNGLERNYDKWVESIGGLSVIENFEKKYFYSPPFALVEKGNLLFIVDTLAILFRHPDSSEKWQIELMGENGKGMVLHQTKLWVTERGAKSKEIDNFLNALFSADLQKEIILHKWTRQYGDFGIFGGFSTFPSVNTSVLRERYPFLAPIIPPIGTLY